MPSRIKNMKKIYVAIILIITIVAFYLLTERNENSQPDLAANIGSSAHEDDNQVDQYEEIFNEQDALALLKPDEIQEYNSMMRNADSIQSLLQQAEQANLLENEKIESELFVTLFTSCPSILNSQKVSLDDNKTWAIEKAIEFCSIDSLELEYFEDLIGNAVIPHTVLADRIQEKIDSGDLAEAVEESLKVIANSYFLNEILGAAAVIAYIQQNDLENETANLLPQASVEDSYTAALSAANIYYCNIVGGCDLNHPAMIFLCAMQGCEPFIANMEQGVRRVSTIRMNELIDQYLSLFWTARRELGNS